MQRIDSEALKAHPVTLREARATDMPFIAAVLNHYVETSTAIYVDDPVYSEAERLRWFSKLDLRWYATVAVSGEALLGFASLAPYQPERSGYRHTATHSIYLHPDVQGRGLGTLLMTELIAAAQARHYHVMVASIDSEQAASIALHTKFGFTKVATLQDAGCKFGVWKTAILMQHVLNADSPAVLDQRVEAMVRAAAADPPEPLS